MDYRCLLDNGFKIDTGSFISSVRYCNFELIKLIYEKLNYQILENVKIFKNIKYRKILINASKSNNNNDKDKIISFVNNFLNNINS